MADQSLAQGASTVGWRPPSQARPRQDRALLISFVAGVGVLAFIAGAIMATAKIFPGSFLAQAYVGGVALYEKLTRYDDVYASDLWYPQRTERKGVTVHSPAQVQPGVTLYSSGHQAAAYLIAADGRVLHTWKKPYSAVWNEKARVREPQPDSHVFMHKVQLFDNGDLLAIYEGVGDTPYGYGMAMLDRDSNVLWSYLGYTHHDFDVGPDGRIYVLTQDISSTPLRLVDLSFDHLPPPRIDDYLVLLSPKGRELLTIDLVDAVARSRYRHMLFAVSSFAVGDPLHTNAVKVITEEMARNFPYGKPGQVLLSFRELGAVAVLDVPSRQIVWATRGAWLGQHDPDILPNGNILLFDNYGAYSGPGGGASRVIEFNPQTMEIPWQYAGTPDHPLDSRIRSNQQRLANGNTLVVESNGGRMFEVTRSGEIVWEYVNPVRGGPNNDRIPIIAWAERVDTGPLDQTLLLPE